MPELLAYQDLLFGQHNYNILVRLMVVLPTKNGVAMIVMRVVPMVSVMAVLVMMVMPMIMAATGSPRLEAKSTGSEQASEMKELGSTKDNNDSMCTHALVMRASLVVLMVSMGRKLVVLRLVKLVTYCIPRPDG